MIAPSTIFCVGTNHQFANIALREDLFIESATLPSLAILLRDEFQLKEIMILSTCNRLEIYGVVNQPLEEAVLDTLFHRLHTMHNQETSLDQQTISKHLYRTHGQEAILHAIRVAASLDSLVLGETQITGQFKDALTLAQEYGLAGPLLDRLGQDALAAGKKIRSTTALGEKTVSIASAAVELIGTIFNKIEQHSVLIIGAGEMARIVAKHIIRKAPKRFAICNRSEMRATQLIQELGRGDFIPFEYLHRSMMYYDIIIAATQAPTPIIEKKHFWEPFKSGISGSKLCVDISMPRNIHPNCSEIDDLFIFDIDDLKQVVDSNSAKRSNAAVEGEKIAVAASEKYEHWLKNQSLGPLLKKTQDLFENIIAREFARTLSKKSLLQLDTLQKEDLTHLAQILTKKLTSHFNRNLQSLEKDLGREIDFDQFNHLFAPVYEKATDEET